LHQNGLTCGCDFDSALLIHAPVEFALHRPSRCTGQRPLSVQRIRPTIDAIEPSTFVDAPQFEIAADRLPVFGSV